MAAKPKDYTGMRFGKLTAMMNTWTKLKNRRTFVWEFLCDCGETLKRDVSIVSQSTNIGQVCMCDKCFSISSSINNQTHGESKTGYTVGGLVSKIDALTQTTVRTATTVRVV